MIPLSQQWNQISLLFDREMRGKDNRRGEALIPIFLDHILEDCCSQDVQAAFRQALVTAFQAEEEKK